MSALGGAAAAWPLAARAQPQAMPVIGYLDPRPPGTTDYFLRAFHLGLKETGYVDGENATVTYRFADGQFDRLEELAAELVRRRVAVISAIGIPAASAAKAATTTIPIVFVVSEDPVSLGLVATLGRPGGNLTGINFLTGELTGKRPALLRELVPTATRVAMLVNSANAATTETTLRALEMAARAMGLQFQVLKASNSQEINEPFATFARERPDALFVSIDPFFTGRRGGICHSGGASLYPRIYAVVHSPNRRADELRNQPYGCASPSRRLCRPHPQGRQACGPAGAAINQFELVINAETARMLGLTVPPTLLARADEVIE